MRHLNLQGDQVAITFPYDPEVVKAVRHIPGSVFDKDRKRWLVPAEWALDAVDTLEPLGFTAALGVARLASLQRVSFQQAQENKRGVGDHYHGRLPLMDFQKRGAGFIAASNAVLLADVPGLGKTIQTIAGLEDLIKGRTLVLCPASLKYGWAGEVAKWQGGTCTVVDGTKEQRKKQWATDSRFTIANYELLLHDWADMPKDWDAIVCDEATRISNHTSKTYKLLRRLKARKRLALTGTPISNTPMDLFSIVDWIAPGYLGNYFAFRNRHCVFLEEAGYKRIVGFKELPALAGSVDRFLLRRTKEEVLDDFPSKTVERVTFKLSDEERKVYQAVRTEIAEELAPYLAGVDKGSLGLAPVKLLRLKQVTGHLSLVGEGTKSSKLEALDELVDGIVKSGEKVIVFTQFAEMAKILLAHYARRSLLEELPAWPLGIWGDVPAERRAQIVENFQGTRDDTGGKECRLLIMTEAGAYGLNLQAASYVVHYDAPWSVAKLTQREDRAHRIGQTKPVTVYHLVAQRTIDEYVLKVLDRKQGIAQAVLQDAERMQETMAALDGDLDAELQPAEIAEILEG